MAGATHITHIEFDGVTYYWWCEADDCFADSETFDYEADAAADGGLHESEEND